MTTRLSDFAATLAAQNLSELDQAIAIVWFLSHESGYENSVSTGEIISVMSDHRLRSNVNSSRLHAKLRASRKVVIGRKANSHRPNAASDREFAETYAEFLDVQKAKVDDIVIPNDISLGKRNHLEQIRREANGCYDRGFYNGSAVMCRRLVELLLVEAMVKGGHEAIITDTNGDIRQFGELIRLAKSNQYIRLSRTTPAAIERVKAAGDAAAHHRIYNAKKNDIDQLNPGLRMALTELASLAGL
jgi:hypothetical protein